MHHAIVWCTSANQKQLFLPTNLISLVHFKPVTLSTTHTYTVELPYAAGFIYNVLME